MFGLIRMLLVMIIFGVWAFNHNMPYADALGPWYAFIVALVCSQCVGILYYIWFEQIYLRGRIPWGK